MNIAMKPAYIKEITSENTGGGCMVDFIHLNDGRVIGLNDECAVLYDNMDEFWDATPKVKPSFEIPKVKKMSNLEIVDIAENAINKAIKHCQDSIGVQTGDFAGLYFSDPAKWNPLIEIIADYIHKEISEGAIT